MRPSKLLVQERYPPSSSLRAWTLRLPSVVSNSFFNSLKVSDSLTASALRIPKRKRSCTSRSSFEASPTASSGAGFLSRSLRTALDLAAIFHRNHQTENHVQPAESRGHQDRAPCRNQQRRRARRHEAPAHQRHDLYRGV